MYAYTKYCRRSFVLKYFGDPAARPKCEGCDNCLVSAGRKAPLAVRERQPGKSAKGKRRGRGQVADVTVADETTELSAADARLLGALRQKRIEIARRDGMPAYIVFSDRTLADMAVKRPASLAAMATVRGVGEMKLARYGESFLAVIRSSDETEAA